MFCWGERRHVHLAVAVVAVAVAVVVLEKMEGSSNHVTNTPQDHP